MSLAKSYARAILETAKEAKASAAQLDQYGAELEQFADLIRSTKEARVGLLGAATASKDKVAAVAEIATRAKLSPLVSRFVGVVTQAERLKQMSEIAEAYGAVRLEAEGGVMGRVASADAIEPADLESLAKSFSQKLGKKVALRSVVDPTLLAGIRVTVGGVTYDGSLRSQLNRLRDRLVMNTERVH